MKKQIRVTALCEQGGSIQSGWFVDINQGEAYAAAMLQKGHIVRREYR
jgi:hypothetical protein